MARCVVPTVAGRHMPDELSNNARQHGTVLAERLAHKIQNEGMAPAMARKLVDSYMIALAESLMAQGLARDRVISWIRDFESAFDNRLSELACPVPPQPEETER